MLNRRFTQTHLWGQTNDTPACHGASRSPRTAHTAPTNSKRHFLAPNTTNGRPAAGRRLERNPMSSTDPYGAPQVPQQVPYGQAPSYGAPQQAPYGQAPSYARKCRSRPPTDRHPPTAHRKCRSRPPTDRHLWQHSLTLVPLGPTRVPRHRILEARLWADLA
jgi:hypothetical protein